MFQCVLDGKEEKIRTVQAHIHLVKWDMNNSK